MQLTPVKQSYLFFSASEYDITDERTGRKVSGVSLWYAPTEDLKPTIDEEALERGQFSRGFKVAKMSVPRTLLPKLQDFPGIYTATIEFTVVAQKLQPKIVDLEFVSSVELHRPKKEEEDKKEEDKDLKGMKPISAVKSA